MRAYLDWLNGDDHGLSSEAIGTHMLRLQPGRWGWSYPLDPSDLGRCLRLLIHFPQWQKRMGEMAVHGPVWEALVEHWRELEQLFYSEFVAAGSANIRDGWNAPKTYARMKELQGLARKESMSDHSRVHGASPRPKCRTGKRVYFCKAEAEYFGKALVQRAYRCEQSCGLWHLTTQARLKDAS